MRVLQAAIQGVKFPEKKAVSHTYMQGVRADTELYGPVF